MRHPRSSWLLLVVVAASAAACGGCVVHVAPPPAPSAELPPGALDGDPAPDETSGMARVAIATDVPARVDRIGGDVVGRWRSSPIVGLLCTSTPCTVTLPYGDHELAFQALGDAERTSHTIVHVTHASEAVRHTLGRTHQPAGQALGVVVALLGVVAVSAALAVTPRGQEGTSDAKTVAGVGLGGILLGGFLMAASPTRVQEGATTQWSPGPRMIGGALGGRF